MGLRMTLRAACGVARSLGIYYGRPWRFGTMDAFYCRFLGPGDLAFDLGSHVGNRIRSWRRLGARVVAVEPQPSLAAVLNVLYGRDPQVTIIAAAIAGDDEAQVALHLNLANPTISTTSTAFIAHAEAAPSFSGQRWQEVVEVPSVTLDTLIGAHGKPRFVKIDVEGYEAEALRGLSIPLPALSVEFVPMHREIIDLALDRLAQLGDYRFNASYGDELRMLHPRPLVLAEIRDWLRRQGNDGPCGDVYASLDAAPLCPSPQPQSTISSG
jgi:FkbM family methyltransferase